MSANRSTKEVDGGFLGGLFDAALGIMSLGLFSGGNKTYETTDGKISGFGSSRQESNSNYEYNSHYSSNSNSSDSTNSGSSSTSGSDGKGIDEGICSLFFGD